MVFDDDILARLDAIAAARCGDSGPAHDHLHVRRVAATARALARAEGGRGDIAVAAALLHELWNYPKDHPESVRSGEVCAEHARKVMQEHAPSLGPSFVDAVAYAISVHSFSRGIVPETLEAKIVQDADRLDALGAIGIARCFATCADMRRPFYDAADPFCRTHDPDDKLWGVDHLYKKLLKVPASLHTPAARRLAEGRTAFLHAYLRQLAEEIG